MPAPFIIVTLRDADGDDFPIRLPGTFPPLSLSAKGRLRDEALKELVKFEADDKLRPNWPVTVAGIEQFGV